MLAGQHALPNARQYKVLRPLDLVHVARQRGMCTDPLPRSHLTARVIGVAIIGVVVEALPLPFQISCSWKPLMLGLALSSLSSVRSGVSKSGYWALMDPAPLRAWYCAPS